MSLSELWANLETELIPVFADYRGRLTEMEIEFKPDRTLLTEADLKVQELIIRAIRQFEPDAVILAEEDKQIKIRTDILRAASSATPARVWVIDPIDGTAEFVQPGHTEFCSVVCLVENWQPVSALILAPELGIDGTPLVITADVRAGKILVNHQLYQTSRLAVSQRVSRRALQKTQSRWISATRSRSTSTTFNYQTFNSSAAKQGYSVKIAATSQTLDMVRTAINLANFTEPELPSFDVFWRQKQKVWDGLAGMCLGKIIGLAIVDESGREIQGCPELLREPAPVFNSTIMGEAETVSWLLNLVR